MAFEDMTLPERTAVLEEKAKQQDKINTALCVTVKALEKHLLKIERIAIVALVLFGLERAAGIMGVLP